MSAPIVSNDVNTWINAKDAVAPPSPTLALLSPLPSTAEMMLSLVTAATLLSKDDPSAADASS